MSKKIFISYRRADSGGYALALHGQLEKHFGKQSVFLDVGGSIQPGANFDTTIKQAVNQCNILLALIGKNWLTISDDDGRRRLDDPNDYVNLEIATALKNNNILVIPVLIDEAKMPSEKALPDNLKILCKCQAIEIRHSNFYSDADLLMLNLGVGKVMSKIAEISYTESEQFIMNYNVEKAINITCPHCATERSTDLRLPCPLCGSRKYLFFGYRYPHEGKRVLLVFSISVLIMFLFISGAIYLILNTFGLHH